MNFEKPAISNLTTPPSNRIRFKTRLVLTTRTTLLMLTAGQLPSRGQAVLALAVAIVLAVALVDKPTPSALGGQLATPIYSHA